MQQQRKEKAMRYDNQEYTVIGVHGFSSTLIAVSPQDAINRVLEAYGDMCGLTASNVLVVTSDVFEEAVTNNECISDLYKRVQAKRPY
jgi:hypothetical protein